MLSKAQHAKPDTPVIRTSIPVGTQPLTHQLASFRKVPMHPQRRDFEGALKEFKLEAEQTEKALQARDGELTGQLQAEQTRLTELNDRLDQIERALSVP